MKKKINNLLLLLACVSPVLQNCKGGETALNVEPGQYDVWSTYSTTKVLQNQSNRISYFKNPLSIDVSLMRGEKESAQLIITAKRDIDNFTLVKTDLTDGFGNTLPREDISIFVQKYVCLKRKFNQNNTSYFAGDYIPDMLLPIDKSIEYHENHINNGENQGLTIDVKTYSETVPGKYTGTFKLYLDDECIDVPVEVNVWNIDGSGKHDLKSCFLVYQNYLAAGEFSNTDELLKRYDEFLLDYQVCFENITNEDTSIQGINNYFDYCMQFLNRDEYNSINIPLWFDFNGTGTGYNFDEAVSGANEAYQTMLNNTYNYFKILLEKTTDENKLVDYTYWYASILDEADMYVSTLLPKAVEFFKKDGNWQKTIKYVVNKLLSEGSFDNLSSDYKNHCIEYLKNLPVIYTNAKSFSSSIDNDLIATLCPQINLFDSQANVSKLLDYSDRNTKGNLWTYTCSSPVNPYPTLHIDDFALGNRVSGWMYKKYKINGFLYWAVDLYQSLGVFGSLDTIVDPYEDSERAGKVPGDGYLVYPGRYYGSDYPFPTNRLVSYRDGVEDYILLTKYEEAVNKYATKYNISIDFDEMVSDLYDSLFAGAKYIQDDKLVHDAREELAKRIIAINNDDHMLIKKTVQDDGTDLTIYTTSSKITVNGTLINGSATTGGYLYSFDAHGDVSFETDQYVYKYSFPERGKLLDFSNPELLVYSKSDTSSVTFNTNKAVINLVPYYKDDDEMTFAVRPYAQFDIPSLKGVKSISFNISSLINNRDIEFRIELVPTSGKNTKLLDVALEKQGSSSFNINLQSFSDAVLENAAKIKFSITNAYLEDSICKLYDNVMFEISSLVYEK